MTLYTEQVKAHFTEKDITNVFRGFMSYTISFLLLVAKHCRSWKKHRDYFSTSIPVVLSILLIFRRLILRIVITKRRKDIEHQ